jgi:SNF2 family DNA or RNA helicase
MRLKQISVSEQLLAEKPSLKKFKKSAKIKVLNEIINDSGDQKLVVFTQFQKSAKLLAKLLDKQKIGYGIIHGGVKTEQRQKEVNKFQNNKDCKVFIATIKTGGLGLTLTAGSIAVFLDKDWTTANNNQAVDRLHRIGQEKNVTVIELLAKDSIEEYIEKLLAEKQKTFDSLIEGKITPKEILLNLKGSD